MTSTIAKSNVGSTWKNSVTFISSTSTQRPQKPATAPTDDTNDDRDEAPRPRPTTRVARDAVQQARQDVAAEVVGPQDRVAAGWRERRAGDVEGIDGVERRTDRRRQHQGRDDDADRRSRAGS